MANMPMPAIQEDALRNRPHLAFVIECLGLASLAGKSSHKKMRGRLERCLQRLCTAYPHDPTAGVTPVTALARWLGNALQEFTSLPKQDFPSLLQACAGNTMPDWLKNKVRSELGEAVSDLIIGCLEC